MQSYSVALSSSFLGWLLFFLAFYFFIHTPILNIPLLFIFSRSPQEMDNHIPLNSHQALWVAYYKIKTECNNDLLVKSHKCTAQ